MKTFCNFLSIAVLLMLVGCNHNDNPDRDAVNHISLASENIEKVVPCDTKGTETFYYLSMSDASVINNAFTGSSAKSVAVDVKAGNEVILQLVPVVSLSEGVLPNQIVLTASGIIGYDKNSKEASDQMASFFNKIMSSSQLESLRKVESMLCSMSLEQIAEFTGILNDQLARLKEEDVQKFEQLWADWWKYNEDSGLMIHSISEPYMESEYYSELKSFIKEKGSDIYPCLFNLVIKKEFGADWVLFDTAAIDYPAIYDVTHKTINENADVRPTSYGNAVRLVMALTYLFE